MHGVLFSESSRKLDRNARKECHESAAARDREAKQFLSVNDTANDPLS